MADDQLEVGSAIKWMLSTLGTGAVGVGLALVFLNSQPVIGGALTAAGVLVGIVGVMWDRIRLAVPEGFSRSLGLLATDARVWVLGLMAFVIYGMIVSVHSMITAPSPTVMGQPWTQERLQGGVSDSRKSGNNVPTGAPTDELLGKSIVDILRLRDGRSALAFDHLTREFIGRRIHIVREPVREIYNQPDGGVGVIAGESLGDAVVHIALGSEWRDRISAARLDLDSITAICRIDSVRWHYAALTDCESVTIEPLPTSTFTPASVGVTTATPSSEQE